MVPGTIATLEASAAGLDAQTNVKADVIEEGTGFTPVLSINITPIEMLNVAVKYEFATKLHLETTVNDGNDAAGMFLDGETKVADMPAQLSVGASLTPLSKLTVAAGVNYFFDKNNDYDGSLDDDINMIDNNFLEYSVGVEYALNSMFRISAGFNGTSTGVNDAYQGSMRYSLNTTSFAGGLGISLTPMIDVNIGGMYTMYEDGGKSFPNTGIPVLSYNETYDTTTWLIGAGVNLHF
jgi:long-chain fatty acid transport protein